MKKYYYFYLRGHSELQWKLNALVQLARHSLIGHGDDSSLDDIIKAIKHAGSIRSVISSELMEKIVSAFFIYFEHNESYKSFPREKIDFEYLETKESLEAIGNAINGGYQYRRTGKFIVLEGTDGIGKSTVQGLVPLLYASNMIETREPGGTPLSEDIRDMLLSKKYIDTFSNKAELLLYYASRVQHIEEKIIPAREAGYDIFSSRFYDSSYAYQVAGRGLDKKHVDNLTEFVCDHLLSYPTLVISMYVDDIQTVLDRTDMRGDERDRLESAGLDFLKNTNEYYKTLRRPYGRSSSLVELNYEIIPIECSGSKESISEAARTCIDCHLRIRR